MRNCIALGKHIEEDEGPEFRPKRPCKKEQNEDATEGDKDNFEDAERPKLQRDGDDFEDAEQPKLQPRTE